MKRDRPSLLAALTVGVLVNVLLRNQTAYWPRAGTLSALFCVPILAATAWLFSKAWQNDGTALFRLLFVALLLYSSVLELLRFWGLAQRLYPGLLSLTAVCLMTLLPVIYLRRISAISQTAHVVLCLVILSSGFLFLTVLPRLHFTNLQVIPLQVSEVESAAREQLVLYPEYLLLSLWPQRENRPRFAWGRLTGLAVWFDVGLHWMLELFYGAAMPLRIDPLHAAARCGALSIFNRLESLQLILWTMAITLKLALYLYAICQLLSLGKKKETSVRLSTFPFYFATLWFLCVVLRKIDLQAAMQIRNSLTWGFVLLAWMGGVATWLCQKIKRYS